MKKKIILVLGGILFLIGIGVGYIFILGNPTITKKIVSPVNRVEIKKPEEKITMKTWDDPLGFSFSYPDNLKLNPHEEDQENYAHLEITNDESNNGKIIIWVSDIVYQNWEEWIKNDAEAKMGNNISSTLGEIETKKIVVNSPVKKIITIFFFDDLFWKIETYLDTNDDWSKIENTIISSFSLEKMKNKETDSTNQEDLGEVSEEVVE